MNYFLVDYENVNIGGLNGVSNLTENDTVIIFYSEKADTLTFGVHRRMVESAATFKFQKALLKEKNALDFQLCSYLGFLIRDTAIEENLGNKYFIVSNDKGYSILPDYWKKFGVNLRIISNLSKSEINPPQPVNVSDTPKTEQNETPQPVNISDTPKTEQNETPQLVKVSDTPKTEQNETPQAVNISDTPKTEQNETSQAVNVSDTPKTEQNETPQPVNISEAIKSTLNKILNDKTAATELTKLIVALKARTEVNNLLCKKFGNQKGGEIYRAIKPFLAKGNSNTPQPVNVSDTIKTALNKILKNNDVVSVSEKIVADSNAKKDVHNNLVKKFGNQKGGEIYRAIKSLLAKGNFGTPQPVNVSDTIKNTLNKILNDKISATELTSRIVVLKARTEVNNLLCKKFGSQKGGEIYRTIKTLIKDKK